MKGTRQRCHVAQSPLETADLIPFCASEIASLTPRSPRRVRFRRNSVQNCSASDAPMSMPKTSRWPSLLTLAAMMAATESKPLLRH